LANGNHDRSFQPESPVNHQQGMVNAMKNSMTQFDCNGKSGWWKILLLAVTLAWSTFIAPVQAQLSTPAGQPPANTAKAARPAAVSIPIHYAPNRYSKRATSYYALFWGIDTPRVKAVESGELIRFSYNVLDGNKATALNDKKAEPHLIFPSAGLRLSVPSLEKVGQLRQSSTPEAGMSYWMAFSNPGRRVKRGDRVNIVIGQFYANGLIVE
jgi:hypothetical protein